MRVEGERVLVQAQGVLPFPLAMVDDADVTKGNSLAERITELLVEGERVLVQAQCILPFPLVIVDETNTAEKGSFKVFAILFPCDLKARHVCCLGLTELRDIPESIPPIQIR